MDNVLDVCKEQLVGWYDSIDRLRVGAYCGDCSKREPWSTA